MIFSPTLTDKKFATTDNILVNTDDLDCVHWACVLLIDILFIVE